MVRLKPSQGDILLIFSKEEIDKFHLSLSAKTEVVPTEKGLIVIVENPPSSNAKSSASPNSNPVSVPATNPVPAAVSGSGSNSKSIPVSDASSANPLDEKLFRVLSEQEFLGKRVVGLFENSLSQEELKRFLELKKAGMVEEFRLSDKYAKPIYRIRSRQPVPYAPVSAKSPPKSNLLPNGFLISPNEEAAKVVSAELSESIRRGEVRGIKGFDGAFYIMETGLYQSLFQPTSDFFRRVKTATMDELAADLKISPVLGRVLCEFLKDDGILFEKKKGVYKIIE